MNWKQRLANWKQWLTPARAGGAVAALAAIVLLALILTSGAYHRVCPDAVCGSSGDQATDAGRGGPQRPPPAKLTGPVITPPSAAPEGAPNPVDRLRPGQRLARGETLTSADGRYNLTLQASDGNLILVEDRMTVLWHIGPTSDAGWLTNQLDGNIVLYRKDGTSIWSSGTVGARDSTLYLLDDGNLVLLDPTEKMLWETDTDFIR